MLVICGCGWFSVGQLLVLVVFVVFDFGSDDFQVVIVIDCCDGQGCFGFED